MASVCINFSPEQLKAIGVAYKNKTDVTLHLTSSQFLDDGISINLTKTQTELLNKGVRNITFSKSSVQSFGNKIKKQAEIQGGFLPAFAALLPFLTKALSVAVPAAAGIYGAVSTKKHNDKMLAESQKQTNILQKGSGMRLTRKGSGMILHSKNLKKN